MNSRSVRRSLALLLAAGLIAAACGPAIRTVPVPPMGSGSTPLGGASPSATTESIRPVSPIPAGSDEIAVYEEIEAQVQELRQLSPTAPVEPVLLDQQGIKDWMAKAYQSVDHEALAAESRLFVRLGLLPEGASLEQLQMDLNSGQAIGFYDVETKKLYLLSESGTVGPVQRLTFSHEYTHALQDQRFDLSKLDIDTAGQSDRGLARTALPEGDATLAMTQWAQAHMSIGDLLAVSLSEGAGEQNDQLAAAPAILREDLLFPYKAGLSFVQSIYAKGGWRAVDALYSNPPASTSQILHPELYAQNVTPAILILPAPPSELGRGWQMSYQDTMGELQLRTWLAGEKPTTARSNAAAQAVSTWGGDRIGLYEGPNDAWAVVLRTAWRTQDGRVAFETAINQRLEGLKGVSTVCSDGLQSSLVIASSPATLAAFQTCQPMD